MITTEKRKAGDGSEYWCPVCQVWDIGIIWRGSGYPELLCSGCDFTLDSDYGGMKAIENEASDDES